MIKMKSVENFALGEIPELAIYHVWDSEKNSESERGIVLLKEGQIVEKFVGTFEKNEDEYFSEFLSQEAINYLKNNPFTIRNFREGFSSYYYNVPKENSKLTIRLNNAAKDYIFGFLE